MSASEVGDVGRRDGELEASDRAVAVFRALKMIWICSSLKPVIERLIGLLPAGTHRLR